MSDGQETAQWSAPAGQVRCSYHPDVLTGLRCSRCGKPICPRCGVRTPVGMRCPDCAGTRPAGLAAAPVEVVKAGGAALIVGVAVGVLWGFFPAWQFYLALLLGFGVCETIARLAPDARGVGWQMLGVAICLVGLVVSRYVLAQRLGLDWADISGFRPRVQGGLQLRPIPDLVFAVMPLFLNLIRFR